MVWRVYADIWRSIGGYMAPCYAVMSCGVPTGWAYGLSVRVCGVDPCGCTVWRRMACVPAVYVCGRRGGGVAV